MTANSTKSDVPTVRAGDLLFALRVWMREVPKGPVSLATTGGKASHPEHVIERRIVDAFGQDTTRSLAVVLRLRCLLAAMAARRFEAHVRSNNEAWIAAAAAAAAGMRVNADIGFSPVRLAWAIAAEQQTVVAEVQAAEAA